MIHGAEGLLRVSHRATTRFQAFERHAASAFVQKHAVDIKEACAVSKVRYLVLVPDFLYDGVWHIWGCLLGKTRRRVLFVLAVSRTMPADAGMLRAGIIAVGPHGGTV
jgi:hypothetical protein